MNLGQTVEKHEEEHILTVEDHQEEKQRARRQKRVPEHYRLQKSMVIEWSLFQFKEKKLHRKCLFEIRNSVIFCRKSRICSTPN